MQRLKLVQGQEHQRHTAVTRGSETAKEHQCLLETALERFSRLVKALVMVTETGAPVLALERVRWERWERERDARKENAQEREREIERERAQ
ncbi:hypothetical protein AgCh_030544 [Apium graveolens]